MKSYNPVKLSCFAAFCKATAPHPAAQAQRWQCFKTEAPSALSAAEPWSGSLRYELSRCSRVAVRVALRRNCCIVDDRMDDKGKNCGSNILPAKGPTVVFVCGHFEILYFDVKSNTKTAVLAFLVLVTGCWQKTAFHTYSIRIAERPLERSQEKLQFCNFFYWWR